MLPSHEWFRARLDRPCLIGLASDVPPDLDAAWPAVLAEVGERRVLSGHEQFAVVFVRTDPHRPEQALCSVAFENAPVMQLLLVPIGQDAAGVRYEACFNRPVTDPAGRADA